MKKMAAGRKETADEVLGGAGRPRAGLAAGLEEPGSALGAVSLQALARRRPGAGPAGETLLQARKGKA